MNPFERLREIVSSLGFSGPGTEPMWFDSSQPACREAEKLLRSGRAAEAEAAFQRILNDPRHAPAARKHMPRILLALADAQIRQEKWREAAQTGARAGALLRDARFRTSIEFAECCNLRAQAARGLGAREEALHFYLQGLAAVQQRKNPAPADVVRRRIAISSLLREMERWRDAAQQAEQAVTLAVEELEGSRIHGDALLEWALCLCGCERFDEARQAGEKAADIHRAACGDHSNEVALDYEKLGMICQKQGDYPAAVAFLEKALGVKERQVGGDTREFALLLVALADLYTLIGRLAPALELLQQAVGKLGPSRDGNLATALEKLGAMYVRTGRYEDAADCYVRANACWSADPDAHADRIAANRQALETLLPWLPEPAAPPVEEPPDPGISVLREAARPQPASVPGSPAQPPSAEPALHAPGSPAVPHPAPDSGGVPVLPAPPAADSRAPAAMPMTGPPGPLPAQTAAFLTAHHPGFQGFNRNADAPALIPAVPLPPSLLLASVPALHAPAEARPGWPPAMPPGAASPAAGLHALGAAVREKRDSHGFCGWEELELEPFRP